MKQFFAFLILSALSAQTHFNPAWNWGVENPFEPHNTYIYVAMVNDVELQTGDEIAVFDGDVCVGLTVLEEPPTSMIPIVSGMDEGDVPGINGYLSGESHPISFRIWDASMEAEVIPDEVVHSDSDLSLPYFTSRGTSVFTLVSGWASTGVPGDVSNDGVADVVDVVLLINVILNGIELPEPIFEMADIDETGALDVNDIVQLIAIIIGN